MNVFSRFLLDVAASIIALLAVIGALALLALGSAAIIRTVIPDSKVVERTALSRPVAWAQSLQTNAGKDEARAARETNLAIRIWAVRCGIVTIDTEGEPHLTDSAPPTIERLGKVLNNLFFDRSDLASVIQGDFAVLQWATIIGIVIGMATTICAGLRSDEQALGSWTRTIRILAVVFPALGTAVASVAAFYGPREELLRASQSLATLQQVHTDIQMKVTREPCPRDDLNASLRIAKELNEWEDKLVQQRPATVAVQMGARAREPGHTGGPTGVYEPPRNVTN